MHEPFSLPRASGKSPVRIIFWTSLWMATLCNAALWMKLQQLGVFAGSAGLLLAGSVLLLLTSFLIAFQTLFAWRWTLKPLIFVLLLMAAVDAYFMLSYGVVIDAPMLTNVMQTNVHEALDLLHWRLFAAIGLLAVLPLAALWRKQISYGAPVRCLIRNALVFFVAGFVFSGVTLLSFQSLSALMRNHTQLRYLINPLNTVYALSRLAAQPFMRDPSVLLALGQDAVLGSSYAAQAKPPLLVLVLGETARAGNFSINGYARSTTPALSKLNAAGELVSFKNAWSCGTSTAASVPCMFSHLGRASYDGRKANYETVLDVLQHAGLAVLWLDNQAGCKGVCDRVSYANTAQSKAAAFCSSTECFDAVMLQDLNARIAQLSAQSRAKGVVVVMHQMGSHGPSYFLRSPEAYKKFKPECQTNALQECEQQSIVNAYDNSIVYTDAFLSTAVHWLKTQEAAYQSALLYVSDHGESLGENNLYLHGLPYAIAPDVQKHVPWVSWFSPSFTVRQRLDLLCLQKKSADSISHDNYFHTILGLMDVRTTVYQRPLDVYASCKN